MLHVHKEVSCMKGGVGKQRCLPTVYQLRRRQNGKRDYYPYTGRSCRGSSQLYCSGETKRGKNVSDVLPAGAAPVKR